jgi:hypothetical protein
MVLSMQESGSIGIANILLVSVIDLLYTTSIVIATVDATYLISAIMILGLIGVLVWGFKPRMRRPDAKRAS